MLSRDRSPYGSAQDVNIRAGQRLLVDHGVTVKFAPGRGLHIHGQLLVTGQTNDRVVFTVWENYKDSVSAGYKHKNVGKNARMKLVNGERADTGMV